MNVTKNYTCMVCNEKIDRLQGCEHNNCILCLMLCCQDCCDISGDEYHESINNLNNEMLLRRLGNKVKIASKIYSCFPKHDYRIILFFGAGGDYFNMPKPKRCNRLF